MPPSWPLLLLRARNVVLLDQMRCAAVVLWLAALGCLSGGLLALNPYYELGVSPNDGIDAVRRSYRRLSLQVHPDKNPSAAAKERWLRVQQAYAALTDREGGGSRQQQHSTQQQPEEELQRRHSWRGFWQEPRRPPPIHSEAADLDVGSFNRWVLRSSSGSNGAASGGSKAASSSSGAGADSSAWLIQLYSHASPYCRVLAEHWEESYRQLGALARFGRIDVDAQPMLVRFLASHVRLFSTPHPSRELPLVLGFPAGCTAMACSLVYQGRFTAEGLQQFAASRLLELPHVPLLSRRLAGMWRRMAALTGQAALLVVLPDGQQPPLALLAALKQVQVQGPVLAAHAVWRPGDAAAWTEVAGARSAAAMSAPALILWRVDPGRRRQPVVLQGSSLPLTNREELAAAIERHLRPPVPQLHAGSVRQLPACQFGASGSGSMSGRQGGPLPEALCVVLLSRDIQQGLDGGLQALEELQQLAAGSSSSKRRQGSTEVRQAAKLLAEGRVQLAWADAVRQRQLCRHLVRWSGTAASASCLCGAWWQHLPARALGLCRQQGQVVVVAFQQQQPAPGSGRGSSGSGRQQQTHSRFLAVAYSGSAADQQGLAAWLVAAAADPERQLLPAPLPAVGLAEEHAAAGPGATVLLQLLPLFYLASHAELLAQHAAVAMGRAAGLVSWGQLALPGMLAAAALALKWLLHFLGGEEEEGEDELQGSEYPPSPPSDAKHSTPGAGARRHGAVTEMQHADWQPSPGRYLVLLPLPAGGGASGQHLEAPQAQQAQRQFASLVAVFQRERRLAFRTTPVSLGACALLLARAQQQAAGGVAAPAAVAKEAAGGLQQQEKELIALVLHPRRTRFQVLSLLDRQQAVLRLEEVLDGCGEWLQA